MRRPRNRLYVRMSPQVVRTQKQNKHELFIIMQIKNNQHVYIGKKFYTHFN